MKMLLCPQNRKDAVLHGLAEKENGCLKDIEILSLSSALHEQGDTASLFSLRLSNLPTKNGESFPVYGEMFRYPSFIQEILSFARKCILYGILPQDLPADTVNEEELKRIVAAAMDLNLCEKENVRNRDAAVALLKNRPDTVIYDQFAKDTYHYEILQELKDLPHEKTEEVHPSQSLHYAVNPRQEAEAVVQDICIRNQTCTIVMCEPQTQLPLLLRILQEYNVPCSVYNVPVFLHVPAVFYSLIELGIHHNSSSLLDAMRTDCFSHTVPDDVYSYLKEALTSVNMPNPVSALLEDSQFSSCKREYENIEKKTSSFYSSIQEELDLLLSSSEPSDILINAFSILRSSHYLKEKAEMSAAHTIRSAVLECRDSIHTAEDLEYFASMIKNLSSSEPVTDSDFCTITDLQHPVSQSENTYVLSVIAKNYPGVPVNKGLFDEAYTEKIKKYPSRSVRYENYRTQLSWISRSCRNELIYSYYTNDYQGREMQLSFDISSHFNDSAVKWKLDEVQPYIRNSHSISPAASTSLFVKEDQITGSISSIERWFACPYSFFLQSGLHLREKTSTLPEASTIGTLQHSVLEKAVNQLHKDYPSINEKEIRAVMDPAFSLMEKMHPHQKDTLHITEERMVSSIQSAMLFLDDYEKHNSFVPKEAELRFKEPIAEGVMLRGTIDRLDTCNDTYLRVLDYKSSAKALSEKKVKAGKQLQLLSYLIIAKSLYHLKPAGAYYESLKTADVHAPAASKNRKDILDSSFNNEAMHTRMMKNTALHGWTFEKCETELDDDSSHISPKPSTQYDYDAAEKCITELYQYFHENILQGNISLAPDEDACGFCPYQPICRFHGDTRKTAPLVMKDIPLKKAKEAKE